MRPKPRWSPLEAETALREHEAGALVSDIAAILGKSQSSVRNFLLRHGRAPARAPASVPSMPRAWTARERNQARALRERGVRAAAIAGALGRSEGGVKQALLRMMGTASTRITIGPRRWSPRPWDAALCELVSLMLAELAAEGGRVDPGLRMLDTRLWMARQEVGLEAVEDDDDLAGRLAARWGCAHARRGPTGLPVAPRDVLELVHACREAHDASCRRGRAQLRRWEGAA